MKLINDSVVKAIDADKAAVQYDNLASAYDTMRPPSGWGVNWMEAVKKAAGGQDRFTALKQEYVKLRNTEALKNLPPGVASDKDIEVAMSAFPDETSNPDLIASFMRGTAKLQRYTSAVEKAKSEWLNQNGSLGAARKILPQTVRKFRKVRSFGILRMGSKYRILSDQGGPQRQLQKLQQRHRQ